jgi:hypothetical protein
MGEKGETTIFHELLELGDDVLYLFKCHYYTSQLTFGTFIPQYFASTLSALIPFL